MHKGGFSERQADAQTEGLTEALQGVAKVSDVKALETRMEVEMRALRAEMKAEAGALRAEMKALRQMMIVGFSLMGTLVIAANLLFALG